MADTYTVNRTQDGAEVRAGLSLDDATGECAILNAQSRMQVGLTSPVRDAEQRLMGAVRPIYGSMFNGEICRYEIRLTPPVLP